MKVGTDGIGFINETALVLYVYLPGSWNGEDSCLTVSPYYPSYPILSYHPSIKVY